MRGSIFKVVFVFYTIIKNFTITSLFSSLKKNFFLEKCRLIGINYISRKLNTKNLRLKGNQLSLYVTPFYFLNLVEK